MKRIFRSLALLPMAAFPFLPLAADDPQPQQLVLNPPTTNTRIDETGSYAPTMVQAKLNVEVKDGTRAVHFIRDNSDPRIVTKAYLIKNADPFVMRGVIRKMLTGAIRNRPVGVESIRYIDGSGVLLISCDRYFFHDVGNGFTMDQLVENLDKKGLLNISGTTDYVYFTRYNSALTLLDMLANSGMGLTGICFNSSTDVRKLLSSARVNQTYSYHEGGQHMIPFTAMVSDNQISAIYMTGIGHDIDESLRFLDAVDQPLEEILLTYKLVEIYAENDQKLGLDFQAGKNNDGIDLFAVGGKYGTNWSRYGLTPNNGYTFSEFYNFNPKWNTKYIDFLTTCGKAKVVSTGTLTIANTYGAELILKDGLFAIENADYVNIEEESGWEDQSRTITVDQTTGKKIISKTQQKVTRTTSSSSKPLSKVMPSPVAGKTYAGTLADLAVEAKNIWIEKGKLQYVGEAADDNIHHLYGNCFRIAASGGIHTSASNLTVDLLSFSVIGWEGDGKARTTQSNYTADIQIGSQAKDFVIGGLTKTSVVRSVSGVPLLKDLPVLGWLFSTETDTVKKSQFVLMASAQVIKPESKLSEEYRTRARKINRTVDKAAKNPAGTLGFQQVFIDAEAAEPAPEKAESKPDEKH